MPERATLSLPDGAWAEAQRRAAVIAPLAALNAAPAARARAAGQARGLAERTIYALLRRWRHSGGLVATLAPRPSTGSHGKGRLPAATPQVVAEAIRDACLTRQSSRGGPAPAVRSAPGGNGTALRDAVAQWPG